MSLGFFNKRTRQPVPDTDDISSAMPPQVAAIQASPIELVDGDGNPVLIFIDAVAPANGGLAILGWTTAATLRFEHEGQRLAISRHSRTDVAQALGLQSGDALGFVVLMSARPAAAPAFTISLPLCPPFETGPLAVADGLSDAEAARVPFALENELARLAALPVGGDVWQTLLATLPAAPAVPAGYHGYLEGLLASPQGGVVAFGWALHPEDAIIWVEDEFGTAVPLTAAFRRERRDVAAAFSSVPFAHMDSGFILHLPDAAATATLRLRVATPAGVSLLAIRGGAELLPADPRQAAAKLFAIETDDHHFHRRAALVDWPVLQPIIDQRRAEWGRVPGRVSEFGNVLPDPAVSIIIPLYRRFDFIEHHLLEFQRDPGLRTMAQIIYVVDDPDIQAAVIAEVERLHELYGVPLRLVMGLRNRGFSGANNLGAAHADGRHLLFMNSDVIPLAPGWLAAMLAPIGDPDVGIVGAQLLFPEGGVQHAGMDFRFLDRFGIWSNQHPGAGLPPMPDDAAPRDVPSVTGACLLIPRALFHKVGGWDTGYLIGDFEDSDLCLAVRAAGKRIVLQPAARLTHLERQSFTGIGSDQFRVRMTIMNGVRHQNRWAALLNAAPASPSDQDIAA